MTRKQHRRWKKANLELKKHEEEIHNERPEWADYEKEETNFQNWRKAFLMECNPSYQPEAVGQGYIRFQA